MSTPILLLDCSKELSDSLIKQGFDVESGAIGYVTCTRHLPTPIYEKPVIIYNPSAVMKMTGNYIGSAYINDNTPEFKLNVLRDHLASGATCLIFVNRVAEDIEAQRMAYDWIPFMPQINFTKDNKIIPARPEWLSTHQADASYCTPIISKYELKIPVLQKISVSLQEDSLSYRKDVRVRLYSNLNGDCIGALIRCGDGQLIILPEYKSNDDVIKLFLRRSLPKIYNLSSKKDLLVDFKPPKEQTIEKEVRSITTNLAALEEKHEKVLEELAEIRRKKLVIINKDETAKLVLKYFDLAYQQEDIALFYLYKLMEAIEKKFGGRKKATSFLKTNVEHNFIGRITNASYGDVRHAPNPGEVIKPWSAEEIAKCSKYAETIICKYLGTLF